MSCIVEIQDTASGLRLKFLEKKEVDDKLPVYHIFDESMNFYAESISEEINKAANALLKLYKDVKADEAKKEQYGYDSIISDKKMQSQSTSQSRLWLSSGCIGGRGGL